MSTYPYFDVEGLPLESLLANWRWLCPQQVRLVAVDAFGDLFLENADGTICRLDVCGGQLDRIAESIRQFQAGANSFERRTEWFHEDVAIALAEQGFPVSKGKCVGYKTPIVFAQASGAASNVYVAQLEAYVAFLGDLHLQIRDVPDGEKVRLIIGPKPESG